MDFEKLTQRFVTWGVFLIPFIPLLVTYSLFFPFITGKNFAFRILTELLFGGWLILMLYNPAYRLKFSWLLGAIVSFVGVIALADIFGENPLKSIWSNFERMEGLVTLVHLLLYFVVLTSVLNTERLWRRFLNTSVGVSVFLGVFGLFQLAGFLTINQGGVRLDATFGNATYLAVYMLFHVFLTAFLLVRTKSDSPMRWVYGGIILLQVFIIYYTATRGAILGLLGGVLLTALLIALFAKEQKQFRRIAIGAIAVVVLIVGGFFLIKDSSFVKNSQVLSRFSEISVSEDAVNARFVIWEMALKGIKEKPILGWGQENFNFVFNEHYDPRLYAQEQWFDRVHNTPLDWLIAGGILGFVTYVSIFITGLFYVWNRRNTFFSVVEKSIFTGLLAGYTFHNLFVFDNLMSYVLFFTVMGLIFYSYREGTKKMFIDNPSNERNVDMVAYVYTPLVIIVTLFSVYMTNASGIRAAHTLIQAIGVVPSEAQIASFEEVFSYNSFGNQEARERLTQIATNFAGSNISPELKQEYLLFAQNEMQKQIDTVPNDARTQIMMGTLLDAYGKYADARVFIEHARELSPQKPAIYFQLGLNTLNQGNVEGALEVFKEAFELAPSYDQARIFYAIGAAYAHDDGLLEDILTPAFGSVIVDNDRLLQAYLNTRQIDKVLAIWELRVGKHPENVQVRLGLAATYLELGRRDDSVREIQKAIELDPNFKQQGEFFINEIRAGRNP